MAKKKNDRFLTFLLVLFIIVLIIIFVASLGQVNISDTVSSPKEFKDTKEQAQRRHDKLKVLIEKQIALKEKLTKRFRRIYFAVRLSFIALWGGYIFVLIKLHWIQNLGDALNYSEAAILVCVALNFLTFGNLSNLNSFLGLIKLKLENWIWGKHINISESIEENKTELKMLKNE